jgi:formate dehydrogenase gamma subunit
MSSHKPLETPVVDLPPRIRRQSLTNRIVHWLVALSTFALFFSGFGQMPMYARYGLAGLPGMAWAADYGVTLVSHYLAGAVLTFAVVYHVVDAILSRRYTILPKRGDFKESVQIIAAMLGWGQEPPSHKYLAEQRLAYAYIGLNTLVLVVTGIVKVAKNMPGASIDPAIVFWSTTAHNAAAMLLLLGVIGHFAAFAIKANRALLPAMFDGTVERAYARHRHPLWYREITVTPLTPRPDAPGTDGSTEAA